MRRGLYSRKAVKRVLPKHKYQFESLFDDKDERGHQIARSHVSKTLIFPIWTQLLHNLGETKSEAVIPHFSSQGRPYMQSDKNH